jgi:hypothetical protein
MDRSAEQRQDGKEQLDRTSITMRKNHHLQSAYGRNASAMYKSLGKNTNFWVGYHCKLFGD